MGEAEAVVEDGALQTAPCDGFRLDTVETEAGLRELAPEWDTLLAAMPRPSPFLSWDWIFTWWRQFGQASRLRVVTARSGTGELLGLAPLHIVRRRAAGVAPVRSLEFLGYRGSAVGADHLDFLSRIEGRHAIVASLVAVLLRGRDWDAVVLSDLAEDSLLPQVWASVGSAVEMATVGGETCYFRPLPSNPAELWAELKRHHPKLVSNVKYYRKRMEQRHQVRFVPEIPAAEVPATMAALARLHGLSRGRKGEAGNFGRSGYRAFHEALVERLAPTGKLYLARLECDGNLVAVLYGFIEGGVLFYYQSGFDTGFSAYGLGTLLVAWVMEDAISRLGAHEFDFLRGAEEYKTRWAAQARRTTYLYGWRSSWAGRASHLEWRWRRRLAPARNWVAARLAGAGPGRGKGEAHPGGGA